MIQQQQKNNSLGNLGDVKELTYYSKTWYIQGKNQIFILPFPNSSQRVSEEIFSYLE